MLDTSIAVLNRAISDARHQIHALELESKIFDENSADSIADQRIHQLMLHLQGKTLIQRRFNYCGLVITVSGMLEQYLDSLVAEFVQVTASIALLASDLPPALLSNHLDLSLEYLNAVARDSYKGDDSVEEIISRLYGTCCNKAPFDFNDRAFAFRRANYRCDLINQVFARVGVNSILQKVYETLPFSQYLQTQLEADDSQNLERDSIFKRLDDLAERRNDVAHGNVTQILSHELIIPYIEFIEAFGVGIREVLLEELFRMLANRPVVFHKPFQVINNSIVCIQQISYIIHVGDYVVAAVPATGRYLGGVITNIQVNNQDVQQADGSSVPVDVGLKVNAKIKDNYWFGIVSKDRVYREPI